LNSTEYFNSLVQDLTKVYDQDESRALAYWVFEDVLLIKRAHIKLIEKELSFGEELKLNQIKERLLKGEPLQYIFGYAWFKDLVFKVSPDVLIPRPETEELVDWLVQEQSQLGSILDIGAGSGCIAIAVKVALPHCQVTAMDISDKALEMVSINAKQQRVPIGILHASALTKEGQSAMQAQAAEVWVSNPPYILDSEKQQMHQNVLAFEPHLALFVHDTDPLQFYKAITDAFIGSTQTHSLYFETSEFYEENLLEWLPTTGLKYHLRKDMHGKLRMLKLMK
jgi:release factor glutamine methyltransferase